MTQKMTYVIALNTAIEFLTDNGFENPEVMDKLNALRDAQVKRANAERKPTKKQLENQAQNQTFIEIIREVLANSAKPLSVAEIKGADNRLTDLSSQKVSAMLTLMGDEVELIPTKRNNTYRLVA